jgi:hypothetical protein
LPAGQRSGDEPERLSTAKDRPTDVPEAINIERPHEMTDFGAPPGTSGGSLQSGLGKSERMETLNQTVKSAAASNVPPEEFPGRPAARAERISIRLDGAPEGPVEIQVQERRGEVHLSLKAAAPEMVARIRESLPQLSERLQGEGFKAETWTPDEAARANPATGEPASQDLHKDGRGRQYRQDAGAEHFSNGRQQRDEKFVEIFEAEGEQE